MKTTTQIAIFLKNEPGVLADICDALAEKKINIHGMTVADTVGAGDSFDAGRPADA